MDSPNCFLSPSAIGKNSSPFFSKNCAVSAPFASICLTVLYFFPFAENSTLTNALFAPLRIKLLLFFRICEPNNENVIASIMLDLPAPF